MIRDFYLSWNRFLKTLEVICIHRGHCLLPERRTPLCGSPVDKLRQLSPSQIAEQAPWFDRQFEVFRAMRKVRDFQPMLCADTKYTVGVLKQTVAAEQVKKGLGDIFLEPLVIHSPRGSRHR